MVVLSQSGCKYNSMVGLFINRCLLLKGLSLHLHIRQAQ